MNSVRSRLHFYNLVGNKGLIRTPRPFLGAGYEWRLSHPTEPFGWRRARSEKGRLC
jgi:hypothetical protein